MLRLMKPCPSFTAHEAAKTGTNCFIVGECKESFNFEVRQVSDKLRCLDVCRESQECSWFTFYARTGSCALFKDCHDLDDESCPECSTGHDNCQSDNPVCFVQAQCEGIRKNFAGASSASDCLQVAMKETYSLNVFDKKRCTIAAIRRPMMTATATRSHSHTKFRPH